MGGRYELRAGDVFVDGASDLGVGFVCPCQSPGSLRQTHGLAGGRAYDGSFAQAFRQLDVLALEILIQDVSAELSDGLLHRVGDAVGGDRAARLQKPLASDGHDRIGLGRGQALEQLADLVEGLQRQLLGGVFNRTFGDANARVFALGVALASGCARQAGEHNGAQRGHERSCQLHRNLRRVGCQFGHQPWREL